MVFSKFADMYCYKIQQQTSVLHYWLLPTKGKISQIWILCMLLLITDGLQKTLYFDYWH